MAEKSGLAKLREPFPREVIGKLPKGGVQLDYVGHAAVTDRLLTVDPEWTWEPFATTEDGLPALKQVGDDVTLWIRLTVCGVTRVGVGTAAVKKGGDALKEVVSDALRNAAMRFGVALDLWSKEELESHVDANAPRQGQSAAKADRGGKAPQPPAAPTSVDPNVQKLVDRLNALDPDARKKAKDEFRSRFGTPDKFALTNLADAEAFVAEQENRPAA